MLGISLLIGLVAGLGAILCTYGIFKRIDTDSSVNNNRNQKKKISKLNQLLSTAGVGFLPGYVFILISIFSAVLFSALVLIFTGMIAISLLGVLFGGYAPYALLKMHANAKRKAREDIWPDVIDTMVAAMRSGMGLIDSIDHVGTAGPLEIREDFAYCTRCYKSTGSFQYAIAEIKLRLADPIADRIFETFKIARDVGGSELIKILVTLGTYLRENQAIKKEAQAKQSWIINAARLSVAAPWIVLLMLSGKKETVIAYNSPQGWFVILAGFVACVVAYKLMIHLARFPAEKRWFA